MGSWAELLSGSKKTARRALARRRVRLADGGEAMGQKHKIYPCFFFEGLFGTQEACKHDSGQAGCDLLHERMFLATCKDSWKWTGPFPVSLLTRSLLKLVD